MEININDTVKVKLTELGMETWVEHYRELGIPFITTTSYEADENGYYEFQLWELMHIFGHKMIMGFNQVFVKNKIITKHVTTYHLLSPFTLPTLRLPYILEKEFNEINHSTLAAVETYETSILCKNCKTFNELAIPKGTTRKTFLVEVERCCAKCGCRLYR